ncbi:MAG: hypothetical protein ABJF49_06130 [Marinomonas sp.]
MNRYTNTRWIFAALALATMPFSGKAQEQEPDQTELSDTDKQQLQHALHRGQALYNYDRAAWLATDAMLEAIKDPAGEGLRGWIVEEEETSWRVTFYKGEGGGYAGVFEGIFDGQKLTSSGRVPSDRAPFDAKQTALVKARDAVKDVELQRCSSQPFNLVIMPTGKADGGLFVYYLVPQSKADAVHLGGHYRFEVRDGEQVDMRKFTNSCIELGGAEVEEETKPAALMISHILDRVPTEIHVFSTFALRTPIYVSTTQNKGLWAAEVSDGQARLRRVK